MNALELKIPPPVVAILVASLMWLASRAPALRLEIPARRTIAASLAVLGVAVAIASPRSGVRRRPSTR